MELQKIRVRKDLERMVINYFLRGEITEEQSARICDYVDKTIGGGNYPKLYRANNSIIYFPTTYTGPVITELRQDIMVEQAARKRALSEIYAPYGEPLPEGVEDFRNQLQRPGLVLILWQKWESKEGIFYNVLWAQSNNLNKCRYTEWSGPARLEQIPYIMPLDNEYNSSYHEKFTHIHTVHVAPEDVLKGPVAGFAEYVKTLKKSLNNDFDYIFNFATEKRNRFLLKNQELISLKLPMRIINVLNDRAIHTTQELKKLSIKDLRKINGLGAVTINETIAALNQAGIKLQEEKQCENF